MKCRTPFQKKSSKRYNQYDKSRKEERRRELPRRCFSRNIQKRVPASTIPMNIQPRQEMTEARRKVIELLDPGSFMEMGEHVSARLTDFYQPGSVTESDGVITGYGTIRGYLVFVFAQDSEVMGGTFGEQHGRKIVSLYEHAMLAKAPMIGLLDCQGFRIEEGLDGLNQFARLYRVQSKASGKIPQIMAVIGQCGGGMSIAAELADVTFIEEGKGKIFVNPQEVVGNAIGNNPYVEPTADGIYDWEEICDRIGRLVNILPPSSDFSPNIEETSDEELNRECTDIRGMLGDATAIFEELSDDHCILETRPDVGRDMVTGFIRIAGQPVGMIGCNTVFGEKRITSDGCDKAAAMVEICDNFNSPILTITDTDGYQTTSHSEMYLPSAAGRLLKVLAKSSVPKINLITGDVVGSAYSLLNSKGLSADFVFMWDTADVSIVNPRQATEVIFGHYTRQLEQRYREDQSSALALARHGFANKVIAPEETRKYLIGALQTFVNSR